MGTGIDVHVSLEPATEPVERPLPTQSPIVSRDANGIRVTYLCGTAFRIRLDGGEVEGRWPANLTLEDAACYLVGPIIRTVLQLRGVTVLHGSAVALDGGEGAIAVIGPSGAGKSTTAASLVRAGAALLTDDTVTLSGLDDRFLVLPGYRGVRLWPSVAPTICAPGQLDRITPSWDKRFLSLTGNQFRGEPATLRAVYVLGARARQGSHRLEALRGRDAFLALAANVGVSYADDRARRAEQFDALTSLVERVPVQRAFPRDDISGAASLAELILDDARGLLRGNVRHV